MPKNKLIQFFPFMIIILFTGFSCSPTDYFSSYRGVNLISDYPFSSASWGLGESSTNLTPYMTWASSSAPNPTVGPNGSSSYQLEIKNLLSNGDFETGSFDPSIWMKSSPSEDLRVISPPDQNIINNKTLFFQAGSAGKALQFDIRQALTLAGLFNQGVYRVTADMITPASHFTLLKTDANDEKLAFFLSSPVSSTSFSLNTVLQSDSKNNFYNFLGFDINTGSSPALQFGDGMTELPVFSLDNVSLVRDNLVMAVQLSLPSINSGTKTLIPANSAGAYKLSFYVMDDANAGSNNHFYASGVSIVVSASVQPNFPATYSRFFPRPASGWGNWTRLELPLGFNFVQNGSAPALTIQISPTNMLDISTGGVRSGSVLLSSPSLLFDGF